MSKQVQLIIFIISVMVIPLTAECFQGAQKDFITLPPGFEIEVFARNLPGARSIALAPGGITFVGTRKKGRVYVIADRNGDLKPESTRVLLEGLNSPNGVAVKEGDLYVAEIGRILRFKNILQHLDSPGPPEVITRDLPEKKWHGWKFIRFGPDGMLYVPVGAPCNVCLKKDPRFATIMRLDTRGREIEIFAEGVRNSVGFDWHPRTGALWFTDNGRDFLGDDLPPDELNHAPAKGLHFGFPHWHGRDIPDPRFGKDMPRENFTPPALELGPHVASLGMRFYTGSQFPPEYRNQIFIAEHGSWNRSTPIGYRITLVRLKNNTPISYEVFAQGWLKQNRVLGRPVDIEIAPDGSLLVSDDYAGVLYRIRWLKKTEL